MVSKAQKRVWGYVKDGKVLKLKHYLRRHPEVRLDFSQGKRQRGPLHLACCRGEDAILRLLLEHGADVLQKDIIGQTALHTAVERAMKHGKTAYDDLVAPLKRRCPEAMLVQNNLGVTPQDLLQWTSWKEDTEPRASSSMDPAPDPEKEWLDKLFGECEQEYFENVYDEELFLPVDEDEEDYMDWADRIREEYYHKRQQEAQRLAASCTTWPRKRRRKEAEEQERSNKELHARLQREHEEYLACAVRKEEETRQGKKRRYEERCAATFQAEPSTSDARLSYSDIPWPAPRGSVAEMVEVMLHGVDRKDVHAFRKVLRRQQVLWHPDKFAQRCGARLAEQDRQKILDTVKALSQELNRQAQSLAV